MPVSLLTLTLQDWSSMADQRYSQTATQLQSSSNPTHASPDQLPSVTDADLEPSEWPGPDPDAAEPVPQVDGAPDSPAQRGRLKGGSDAETLREESGSQPDGAEEGKCPRKKIPHLLWNVVSHGGAGHAQRLVQQAHVCAGPRLAFHSRCCSFKPFQSHSQPVLCCAQQRSSRGGGVAPVPPPRRQQLLAVLSTRLLGLILKVQGT